MTRRKPIIDLLFLATIFTVTFEKVHWSISGDLSLSDVLTTLFLLAFAFSRFERLDGRFARCAAVTFGFFVAFLIVYLLGYFNLDTDAAIGQWAKGFVKFMLHFLLLFAAVALVARRGRRFYWLSLAVFCGGMVFNGLYGVLQLGLAQATGGNLDALVLSPLTGGTTKINVYGAIGGTKVYRPNALTGDPNHLGIMLVIPLLVLLPIYLRLERGHRLRTPLLVTLMFLLVVEVATFSRSGMVGLMAGLVVLAIPYGPKLRSRQVLKPLALVVLLLAILALPRARFFYIVLKSRINTGDRATSTHFGVYDFIPDVLGQHPLLGLGLNNFSVYYQSVTGRDDFGPHSFWVALFVETGILGALLFAVFLGYLFHRLALTRRLGQELAARGDELALRVRPLAWGLTAALVATMVANLFYLTMSFYYFFVLAALIVVAPAVFRLRPALQGQREAETWYDAWYEEWLARSPSAPFARTRTAGRRALWGGRRALRALR